jgi:hypothetical protein
MLGQHQSWEFLLTLDESWFYLSRDHEIIWLRESESPIEKEKHMIQVKRKMITMIWNPHGFHIVHALPKGENFNVIYYVEHILQLILEYYSKSIVVVESFMQTMPDRR